MRNAYTITGDTLKIFVSNFITLRPSSSLTRDSARALIGCTCKCRNHHFTFLSLTFLIS